MDRYGLASGKRINDTICDREFALELHNTLRAIQQAKDFAPSVGFRRMVDRNVKNAVIRLVRAALDVERQRCFEKGMEAFAAMPMVRERNVTSGPGFWTGD